MIASAGMILCGVSAMVAILTHVVVIFVRREHIATLSGIQILSHFGIIVGFLVFMVGAAAGI